MNTPTPTTTTILGVTIKHDIIFLTIFIVFTLGLVGLILTGVDTDSLCSPPRNIGLYRPIGLGRETVCSRIVAYTNDVDPLFILPSTQAITSQLFNKSGGGGGGDDGDNEYHYSAPRTTNLLWAWLRFVEHDLVEFRRNDTNSERDDYLLDKKNNSQQINYASPYLDLSQIYGNDFQQAQAIRRDDGTGKLLTNYSVAAETATTDSIEGDLPVFSMLDARHGDSLIVDALYALFIREHNYWCDRIYALRLHLLGYDYYNIARHIVIAEMQAITYRTILPLLIGDTININVPCFSNEQGTSMIYSVDHYVRRVSVYNEFATAVLPAVYMTMEDGENTTNNDEYLWENGLSGVFINASKTRARQRDIFIDDKILDLANRQLEKERDHQIPPFQQYYNHYIHDMHVTCQRFAYDRSLCNQVAAVFNGEQIDLFTGTLLERKFSSNALLGNIAAHMFANQFTHLKRNDHYFYLWDDVVKPYLSEIHHVSLAKIILRNTAADVTDLKPNVFEF